MSIPKALSSLQKTLEKYGSGLTTFTSDTGESSEVKTTFLAAYTGYLLGKLLVLRPDFLPALDIGYEELLGFLSYQIHEKHSANYWPRGSSFAKDRPYPDDLDDTALVTAALVVGGSAAASPDHAAQLVRLLTKREVQPGGPYYTWLVPETASEPWLSDVDLVVNTHIGLLMQEYGVTLPGILQQVEEALDSDILTTPYYPFPSAALLGMSWWYAGEKKHLLEQYILKEIKKNEDATQLAALLLAAKNQRITSEVLVLAEQRLWSLQRADGSWPASPWYLDRSTGSVQYFGESPCFTQVLCLLATLSLPEEKLPTLSEEDARRLHLVEEACKKLVGTEAFSEILAHRVIQGLRAPAYLHEIWLAPWALSSSIPEEALVQLGAGSVLGWIGYTLLDECIDGTGSPVMLATVPLVLRGMHRAFLAAAEGDKLFASQIESVLNRIDAANTWEVANAQWPVSEVWKNMISTTPLPSYEDVEHLADRSIGHALVPIAIALRMGGSGQHVLAVASNYLAARQLLDDAHDWWEDLNQGRISAACVLIIAHMRKHEITLEDSPEARRTQLQDIFWYHVSEDLLATIEEYLAKAERAASEITVFAQPLWAKQRAHLASAVERTRKERAEALAFIEAYRRRA